MRLIKIVQAFIDGKREMALIDLYGDQFRFAMELENTRNDRRMPIERANEYAEPTVDRIEEIPIPERFLENKAYELGKFYGKHIA